jgi:transposase
MLLHGKLKVYIARDRVDLRKSYDGLSLLTQEVLREEPLSGHLFVFFNRRLDKVKVLYWDKNGFCLWQKRLEKGRFRVDAFQAPCWVMSLQEFHLLLWGVDIKHLPARPSFQEYVVG